MNRRTTKDLGYDTVIEEVKALCLSDEGRSEFEGALFLTDSKIIAERQNIIEDLISLSSYGIQKPTAFPPLNDVIQELSIPRRTLNGDQLFRLSNYIEAAHIFVNYCRAQRKFPGEAYVGKEETVFPAMLLFDPIDEGILQLGKKLEQTLESPGAVKPSHPAIARLTREVERKRAERQSFSQDFLQHQQGPSANVQPVFRDGRVVLPVRNDQRSQTDGIIHSSSASGATVFMEPYRLVDLNNQVVMAQQQIQIEIARILAELSKEAQALLEEIKHLIQQIAFADSLYARSRYAEKQHCVRPQLSNDGTVKLLQARHPLLRKKAVPITLEIESPIKAVVISGPNAGGKTVTIKTVGLFAMMHQSLYMVPAKEGTTLPIYTAVHTDIGDDQSIEQSLSTFSGHMKNIGEILRVCDAQSLVILDELGSGTDPVEGSALARSILEYCVEHAALTLVTSHHGVLKQYAYAQPELLNASMEFDGQTHEPTFTVISGLPGESHALESARNMHVPEAIIERAQSYLGSEMVEISTIIRSLEEKRQEAELRERALDDRARQVQEEVRKNDLKNLTLKQREQLLRQEQIGDLSRFIAQKRSELENLVAELREGEITKEKTRKVKAFIASMERKQNESEQKAREMEDDLRHGQLLDDNETQYTFSVGMDVLAGPHKREGRIVRKEKQGKWLVAIGPMKFPMEERDLRPIPSRIRKERKKVSVSYESRSVAPRPSIDVRGMTLQQALEAVSAQVEGALVHSMQSFSVIHGMGDGVLARGIHDYLRTVVQVSQYYYARPEDGGYGKTYIELY